MENFFHPFHFFPPKPNILNTKDAYVQGRFLYAYMRDMGKIILIFRTCSLWKCSIWCCFCSFDEGEMLINQWSFFWRKWSEFDDL